LNRKIIITVLSTIKDNSLTVKYSSDLSEVICTNWSSGAGLYYLLKTIFGITDIICMCSDEVNNSKHKDKVKNILNDCGCGNIEPVFIGYKKDNSLNDITNCLIKEFGFRSSDTLYIDTTGGYRSVVYSLVYLFRYFEYKNITVEKAVYSSFDLDKETGKIENIKSTFRMFDLLSGAHEFTKTGNPQTLIDFFSGSTNPKIRTLLTNMTEFYDEICLCRLNNLASRVKRLKKSLNDLKNDIPNNFEEALFINLIPTINAKFYSSKKYNATGLIKWCLSNNLLQQAITIYVDKLPDDYFNDLKFLSVSTDFINHFENKGLADVWTQCFLGSADGSKNDEYFKQMDELISGNESFLLDLQGRNWIRVDNKYNEKCKKAFDTFKEICDKFYDDYGNRKNFGKSNKEDQQLIEKFGINNNIPTEIKKLIKLWKNNSYCFGNYENETSGTGENGSLYKNYKRADEGFVLPAVTVNVDKDTLNRLRLDYLFVKFARNQINHASTVTDNENKFKEDMADKYGYKFPENNNFSASEIRKFLSDSIEYIEKIQLNKENNI